MDSFLDSPLFKLLTFLLIIVFMQILYNKISTKHSYSCSKCGKDFKASPLQLKCPNCGDKNIKPSKNIKR